CLCPAGGQDHRRHPGSVLLAHRARGKDRARGRCPVISAIALKQKTYLTLGVLAVLSIIIFVWPLIVNPESFLSDDAQAPLYLALVIPLVLAAVISEISEDGFDVKAVAMLGVLSAMVAIVRPFGAGTAGFEAVFFILILGGRAFGPGFGFILGNTGLFAS